MRDFTLITSTYGKTVVALATWRNANATAFAHVTISRLHCADITAEAKSQGPSAGGYNKPTQALERLTDKLGVPALMAHTQQPETWAQMLAQHADGVNISEGSTK